MNNQKKRKFKGDLNQNISEIMKEVSKKENQLEQTLKRREQVPLQSKFITLIDQSGKDQAGKLFPSRLQLETGFGPLKLDQQARNKDFDKYLGGIVLKMSKEIEQENVEMETENNKSLELIEQVCVFDPKFDNALEKFLTTEVDKIKYASIIAI